MKKSLRAFFASAVDIVSVILVCLFPLVSGGIFFRLLKMSGTPVWFYVLQGLLFAGSVAQLILLVCCGLIPALRRKGR